MDEGWGARGQEMTEWHKASGSIDGAGQCRQQEIGNRRTWYDFQHYRSVSERGRETSRDN